MKHRIPTCKVRPLLKGGGIFKCSPTCQVVYILLLEDLGSVKLGTMDTVWPESGGSAGQHFVALYKLDTFWWNTQKWFFGLEISNHTLNN